MGGSGPKDGDGSPHPRVGIVIVNYFQERRTVALLERLRRAEWPAASMRVVTVDNGSDAGFETAARNAFPGVRVLRSGTNLGFGGGCNLGIAELPDCEYVALLNNDATPELNWLIPLVRALQEHPSAGVANPKVLFADRFIEVRIRSDAVAISRTDPRALGLQLLGARVNGREVSNDVSLVSGFWGWESSDEHGSFAWTSGRARLQVPVDPHHDEVHVELRLASARGPIAASVEIDGVVETVTVHGSPAWVTAGITRNVEDVINNVGALVLPTGEAADRGDREVDRGQYDVPEEVMAWSGAAVLLRRAYLDDVGLFDERLFLYYEDTDLAWRGRLLGWTYRYVPAAVVRHEHSATVGERSPLVRHLSERNRLLVLTKCAPLPLLGLALGDLMKRLGTAATRDLLVRPLQRERPLPDHVLDLLRPLLAYLVRLPAFARDRRRLQKEAARRARSS